MCEKGHHHGARPEVEIAGLHQAAHAGIDQGIAGAPLTPGVEPVGIMAPGMGQIAPIEIFKFHSTLHLKLLDEVAVPVQSGFKSRQRTRPTAPILPLFERVVCLTQAEIAPGQIGRQSRAMHPATRGL